MKITVEAVVKAKLNKLWDAWNNPADIKHWNTAQDDWHTTRSTVDLREGGKFLSRMEAKTAARASTSRARTPASCPTRPSNTG